MEKQTKIKLVETGLSVNEFKEKYPLVYAEVKKSARDDKELGLKYEYSQIETTSFGEELGLKQKTNSNKAGLETSKDSDINDIKKEIEKINRFINDFNNYGKSGRYLSYELAKWAYSKEDQLLCLKVAADKGDNYAQYEYATKTQDKEEIKNYLLASASAGNSLAIKKLAEYKFFGHPEFKKAYDRIKTPEKLKYNVNDLVKLGKDELQTLADNVKNSEAFSKILTIVGLLNSDDFDSWIVNARSGGGYALGKIQWENKNSTQMLADALKLIEKYENVNPLLMTEEEFNTLKLIVKNQQTFDKYLEFSFKVCSHKLYEGGLPTSYEVGIDALKDVSEDDDTINP